MSSAVRASYDHRIKHAVVATGDANLFPELSIPASTRRTWMSRGVADVVTFAGADADVIALRAKIGKLSRRVEVLTTVVRLLVTLVRTSGISLERTRVPAAPAKSRILRAVAGAEPIIGRQAALMILGLSDGRLRHWKRRQVLCALDDAPPCPKTVPGRLSRPEVSTMRDMVESDDLKPLAAT